MSDHPLHRFVTRELNSGILSTPFLVQTNWHVITGAPCSGKTTLIDHLAAKGFQTIPETARLYFEQEMAKGRSIDEIREDAAAVERGLIDMQFRFERGLCVSDVAFLDRGVPDGLTFCRVAGLDPNSFLSECFHHRYASVFVLDRIPIQQDNVRIEDDAIADLIDKWLEQDYCALGYGVVRVPVLAPQERLALVLERLSEEGMI